MKHLQIIMAFCAISLMACSPCDDLCEGGPDYATCSEKPVTDGITCEALFTSWIYDEATGDCSKQSYSGCEPLGFETKEECEKCDCYRLESTNN